MKTRLFFIFLFLVLLGAGIYLDAGGVYASVGSIALLLLVDINVGTICLICHTLISDDLLLAPGLSYSPVLIGVFILKCFFTPAARSMLVNRRVYPLLVVCVILQIISLTVFDNQAINLFRFMLNLVLLLFFSNTNLNNEDNYLVLPLSLSFTLLIGCLISVLKSSSFEYLGIMRYSGIWFDENFCSMYCCIGLLGSVYAMIRNRKSTIIAIPSILVSLYIASLSMSRTFIFVSGLLAIFATFSLFRNNNVKGYKKLLIVAGGVVFAIVFFDTVVSTTISNRGVVSEEGDWSNSRMSLSGESIKAFLDYPASWLVGLGISNCHHFKGSIGLTAAMSHNTYIDALVELGLIIFIVISTILCKYVYKLIKELSTIGFLELFCVLVILYMLTLSMGQYSLIYIVMGQVLYRLNIKQYE